MGSVMHFESAYLLDCIQKRQLRWQPVLIWISSLEMRLICVFRLFSSFAIGLSKNCFFLREDTRNALSNSFSAFPLRDRMGGKSKKINCLLFSCLSRVFIHFEALFCFTSDSFSTLFFTPGVSRNETENWKWRVGIWHSEFRIVFSHFVLRFPHSFVLENAISILQIPTSSGKPHLKGFSN